MSRVPQIGEGVARRGEVKQVKILGELFLIFNTKTHLKEPAAFLNTPYKYLILKWLPINPSCPDSLEICS